MFIWTCSTQVSWGLTIVNFDYDIVMACIKELSRLHLG